MLVKSLRGLAGSRRWKKNPRVELAELPVASATVEQNAASRSNGVRRPTFAFTGQSETRGWPKRFVSGARLLAVRKKRVRRRRSGVSTERRFGRSVWSFVI